MTNDKETEYLAVEIFVRMTSHGSQQTSTTEHLAGLAFDLAEGFYEVAHARRNKNEVKKEPVKENDILEPVLT